MPIDVITKDLVAPRRVEVSNAGDVVTMKFGNVSIDMHYLDVFRFAHWARMNAKQCKKRVGDNGRHLSVMGTLSDAEENYKRGI